MWQFIIGVPPSGVSDCPSWEWCCHQLYYANSTNCEKKVMKFVVSVTLFFYKVMWLKL